MVGATTGLCGKLSLSTNGIDHNAEKNCVTKERCPNAVAEEGFESGHK